MDGPSMDLEKLMAGVEGGAEAEDEETLVYEDIEVGAEADVSKKKDGGVLKKVLAKGTGEDRPQTGDEVTVHYTGTLIDGTKFDSSVDRGDPFKFKLGVGQVIKGWDDGVASMRKGEKAILTCTPDYAYGARGSPPTIPANSTLKFEVELFSWTSDNDLFSDGGAIRAKFFKRGTGYGFPKSVDEASVTYAVAEPEGKEIIPTTDAEFAVKDAPFEGLGAVLTKMKEGESCLVKLTGSYCNGLPGAPSAANLTVTLKSWKNVEPICAGQGTLKTLTAGEGWDTPNDGARCTVSYAVVDASTGAAIEDVKDFVFETGNDAIPSGLEEALMKMKKGETAEAVIPAAFASKDVDVKYTVTLNDFEKEKEAYAMNTPEKIEAAEKVKGAGNEAYKAGKLALASKKYDKALRYVEYDQSFTDDEKVKSKALKLSLHLNSAAVALKQKEWRRAMQSAGKALDIEMANEKALYRRAQAAAEVEEYEEAKRDVKKLLEMDEKHREGRTLLARIKKLEAAQAKKDAKVFGGMFSKLGGLYKEEKAPEKADEGDGLKGPIDIGHGFSMEEIKDEDGEGRPAKSHVSKEFQ